MESAFDRFQVQLIVGFLFILGGFEMCFSDRRGAYDAMKFYMERSYPDDLDFQPTLPERLHAMLA